MTFSIGDAFRQGVERTIQRNGLLFAALFFVLSALNALVVPGETAPATMPEAGTPTTGPLGLSPTVAVVLSILAAIVSVVLSVAALRTFVSEETERLPGEHFRRSLLFAVVNLLVGGIVFGIVVGLGFVLLVVPGLFLLVSLYFWNVFVVVEDRNFVDGFRRSWALTKSHRLRLFGLGLLVVVTGTVVSGLFAVPGTLIGGTAGAVLSQVGSALTTVLTLAITARAYVQLADLGDDRTEPTAA